MKKQAAALVSLLIVLAGLSAALLLLRSRPPEETPTESLSMIGSFEVFRFDGPIAEVTVVPADGTAAYTVAGLPDDSGPDGAGSTLVGRAYLPIDTTRTDDLLSTARSLEATRLLYEDSDDYASFGLVDPLVTVRITGADGEQKTLLIGDLAPDRGNYYVRLLESPTIWLVPSYRLSAYLRPETGYIDTTVTAGGAYHFYGSQSITLGGAVRAQYGDIVITPVTAEEATPMDMHTFSLRSPVYRPLQYQYGLEAMMALCSIQAAEVLVIDPDESQLSLYGLDAPYATASLVSEEYGDFRLLAGEPDASGKVNLMREGIPLIYRVNESDLPWLGMQFFDLMNLNVSTLYLDDIDEILVSTSDRTYRFVLDHSDSSRLEVDIDGRRAHRANFMTFCETLRQARYEEITTDPLPEGAAWELQITYRYLSGEPDKVFSFYPGPARKYYVDAGEMDFRFYTSSLYVDKVISQVADAALPGE